MNDGSRVAVLGAGGHTGRFVVNALRDRGAKVIAATRSGRFTPVGGREEECLALDFSRSESLDHILAGAAAVINCAGPFFDTAAPAVAAALRARIPYLDVAAEQMTVLRLFEQYDAQAKEAKVAVVPAMAFFGGLADLLVSTLASGTAAVDAVEIAVGLDSWHPTSGTRLTGERNVYERMVVRDGRLAPVPAPPPAKQWNFPAPLGVQPVTCVALSEIILISRHVQAGEVTSFMNLKPLEDLQNASTPPPAPSGEDGRSSQQFFMDVRVVTDGRESRAVAQGLDIYGVTAPLVTTACLSLLGSPPGESGVKAAGEVFEPRAFLASLEPDITVRFSG